MFVTLFIIGLAITVGGLSERVTLELANGGVSRPLSVEPLPSTQMHSEFPVLPDAVAQSMVDPNVSNQEGGQDKNNSFKNEDISANTTYLQHELTKTQDDTVMNAVTESKHTNKSSEYHSKEGNDTMPPNISTELVQTTRQIITTKEPAETSSMTPQVTTPGRTSTTSVPSTSSKMPSSHHSSTGSPSQSTKSPTPELPCHQSCFEALSATHLYSKQSLLLSQGSDLTLVCEIPLNPSFILTDLIWLHQPEKNLTGQCSLTSQEFIHKCQGFQTINDTKDRNSTFVQESITVVNILASNSGQYMCQVKVTCCSQSQQHSMSQERITHIKVQVWLADYTVDLAIAGSVTAALAIILFGGSYYISRKQRAHYTFITKEIHEIKPATVLHMPLVDEQDTDSFDSNFDEQDYSTFA